MVEPMIYFALGFLVAALIGLAITPLVHARAVRLTAKRLEDVNPYSLAEIQAEKDQQRAEFALAIRKVELARDEAQRHAAANAAEMGRRVDAINRLKSEIDVQAEILAQERARSAALDADLQAARQDGATKAEHLAAAAATYANLETEHSHQLAVAERQQGQIALLETEITALKAQMAEAVSALDQARKTIDSQQDALTAMTAARDAERLRVTETELRLTSSEEALSAGRKEYAAAASGLASTAQELAEAQRRAVALEQDNAALQRQIDIARQTEGDLRDALENHPATPATFDSPTLRDRINEIAAKVTAISAEMEGARSPIPTMLANAPVSAAIPADPGAAPLIEHIRRARSAGNL